MSCCGQRRAAWAGAPAQRPTNTAPAAAIATAAHAVPARLLRIVYEFVGTRPLMLASPHTGKRYRFDRPGARLEIDARDRALVDARPELRQVR